MTTSELDGTPLTVPKLMFATSADEIALKTSEGLSRCRNLLERILEAQGRGTLENTLVPYDELLLEMFEISNQADDLFNLHPDKAIRDAGEKAHLEAKKFETELSLNRELYEAFDALDVSGEDEETKYAVFKILRDFRRAGVDRDDVTRAKIRELRDEIVAIGQEFDRNINEDIRSVRIDNKDALEGLPDDYIEAHPPGEDGRVVITTQYPDLWPVLTYAKDEKLRRRLMKTFMNKGHPANLEVLDRLLARRHELATILGYDHYADFITEDKMIRTGQAAREFIERVAGAASDLAEADYEILLRRKRRDKPDAKKVNVWDRFYYPEVIKVEEYGFDAREARSYFQFSKVLEGLLSITSRLFGLRYTQVEDGPSWHDSVLAYDVHDGEEQIGRFYLDLHPRDGKYGHAASATIVRGVGGKQLPQGVLMCNFPDPGKGSALMEHSQVITFFHEFGHLLHSMLSGRVKWSKNAPSFMEWDFIEVPSQLLEEWARDPEVLQSFAVHYKTGQSIPAELVQRMKRAEAVSRGLMVRRQMSLAALSLQYYNRDPSGMDTTSLAKEVHERYDPLPWFQGTHFQCGFGHLNGYSAIYYTYMWSLVIEKDIFSLFRGQPSLLDTTQALRYRQAILESGSGKPAGEMVVDFLGREHGFEAFQNWLHEASE